MSVVPAPEVRTSSEAAFAEMYERHADRIYAFCRRRLRSREEAEDAVQETFVAAMRAINRGSVPLCESAWLFKIAENVCFAAYRSGARRPVRDLSDSDRIDRLPARDRDGDALIGLEAALETLPIKQRNALLLRELRGLSYKEIALQLGVSVPAVETLIYRARRGLVRGLENGAGLGRRVTAGLNLGSALSVVKGWFAGATAVKVASAASVAALASLAAGDAPKTLGAGAEKAAARAPAVTQSALPDARRQSSERPESTVRQPRRDFGRATPDTRPTPSTARRGKRPPAGGPVVTEAPPAPAGATGPQESPAAAPTVPSSPAPVTAPQPAPSVPAAPPVPELPEAPNAVVDLPPVQLPEVQLPEVQLPGVQLPGVQLPSIQLPPVQVQVPPVQVPPVQVPDLPILP